MCHDDNAGNKGAGMTLDGIIEAIGVEPYHREDAGVILEFCWSANHNGLVKYIINKYHKYMKYKDTCNRRLNWLIYESKSGNLIGTIGINSGILVLKARDDFIGWDKNTRLKNINMIANNYRFTLISENITIKNAGTKCLKLLRSTAPSVWKNRYNNELFLLETLVKPPWTGAIYKADNWVLLGQTKGYSFSKAPTNLWKKETGKRGKLSRENPERAIKKYAVGKKAYDVNKTEPKLIFIKPLSDIAVQRLSQEVLTL